jgi:hypothetical protein
VVKDKAVLAELEEILIKEARNYSEVVEDLTYPNGSKSMRRQCQDQRILTKLIPLMMPFWQQMMPSFDIEKDLLAWSVSWYSPENDDPLGEHFDGKYNQWCMAVVFSLGARGNLLVQSNPDQAGNKKRKVPGDGWISYMIPANSLYILRGSEYKHKNRVCEDEVDNRTVLVMFVKGQKKIGQLRKPLLQASHLYPRHHPPPPCRRRRRRPRRPRRPRGHRALHHHRRHYHRHRRQRHHHRRRRRKCTSRARVAMLFRITATRVVPC